MTEAYTPIVTIVEFLNARYDEAEAGIRDALRTEDWGVTERDLADIAAKRQIVEYASTSDSAETLDHPGVMFTHHMLVPVLKLLAAPYADHPDYNPDWKA